jgi:hypothetical protein
MRRSWTWLLPSCNTYNAHPYADAYSNAYTSGNSYTNANREIKERANDGPAS